MVTMGQDSPNSPLHDQHKLQIRRHNGDLLVPPDSLHNPIGHVVWVQRLDPPRSEECYRVELIQVDFKQISKKS